VELIRGPLDFFDFPVGDEDLVTGLDDVVLLAPFPKRSVLRMVPERLPGETLLLTEVEQTIPSFDRNGFGHFRFAGLLIQNLRNSPAGLKNFAMPSVSLAGM
jgi:hypothetical protein